MGPYIRDVRKPHSALRYVREADHCAQPIVFSFWSVLRGACGNSLPSSVQEFVVGTEHSLSSRSKIRMWIKSEKLL